MIAHASRLTEWKKLTARRSRNGMEAVMKLAKGRVLLGVLAATLAVGILSNPVPVEAQSLAMRVNIPFAFHVGRETLPAGIYIVRNVSDALWINDGNGHTAVVLTNAIKNRAAGVENQIVFNRYANDYFLSEARWSGYGAARGLMKTRFELELATAMSPQPVLAAALTR